MIDGTRTPTSASEIDNLISNDFQLFDNLLSKSLLAAYLQGYDATRDRVASFAESDPELVERIGSPIGIDLRFDVPPEEAIDYFRRKKIVSEEEFRELSDEAKQGAFAVSKLYREDLTQGFYDEILSAIENGTPERQVVKRLRSILDGQSGHAILSNRRLETVVRTNMQLAYAVGRRSAQEEVRDILPIWEYQAVGDDRTRPSHRALDGIQYPADHVFWDRYYPPWDFGCRCTVIPLPSYRDGYKHSQPNGDSSVDFDSNGMPASATIDGERFEIKKKAPLSVPRRQSLAATIATGVERAKDKRA